MPTIQIFINTTRGDIKRAFVKSTAAATTDANPPALVVGNKRDVEIYLVDDAGNYDARSGAVGYSMAFGAGPVGAIPSGGTFTLSDGTNATAAIARNATAAQVQTALNAIDGGAGPFGQQVIVTTGAQGVYTVKFSSTGAVANLIGEGSELTPESTVVVNQSIAGSATVKERQFIRLMREPVVYTDTFTPITNGWSGTLSANNARAIELMAGKSIIATDLDVELTASGGVPETIARGQIAIANEVINPLTLDAEELAIALTIAAGDARYLQRSNDLSDLASASAARGNLGLGNVDNTSDASKPVSTAQQAAIDLKADVTALTAETDAREDADNRRAFSGGVVFDGVAGTAVTNNIGAIGTDDFTLACKIHFKKTGATSSPIALTENLSGSGQRIVASIDLNGGFYVFSRNNDTSQQGTIIDTSSTINLNNKTKLVVLTRTGNLITCYLDGVSIGSYTGDLANINFANGAYVRLGARSSNLLEISKSPVSDVAILNTVLTSAQAAEIYRDGLQPWLAANPEFRQGGELYASDYSAGIDGGTGVHVIATGDNDGVTDGTTSYNDVLKVVANTANNKKYFAFPIATKVAANDPDVYSFKFKYFIPSGTNITNIRWFIGGTGLSSFFGGSATFTETGTWIQIERVGTITSSLNTNAALRFYLNGSSTFTGDGVNDIVYIRDVELVKLGALANLPLDDDSRQLKDISGNRNDATASEAGVNHLIQQNTHSFRDDHADGTGGSYLIANSDILAENEVITGVTMDGRFYAATEAQDLTKRRIKLVTSGSHIEVKRSDGTTDDAANVTTHPASTTDFAVNVLTQRI